MKKKMDLALQATYDAHRDRIVLVADKTQHPALSDSGFHVALKSGTDSEQALREQLEISGVIPPPDQVRATPTLRDLYPPQDAAMLELLVDSGRNIAVAGGTASGKSTLLDAMAQRVLNTKPLGRTVLMHEEHAFEALAGPRVRILETLKGMAFANAGYSVVVKDEVDPRWVLAEPSLLADALSYPEPRSARAIVDEGAVLYVGVHAMDPQRTFAALNAVRIDTVVFLERDANADVFTYPNVNLRFYVEGRQIQQ